MLEKILVHYSGDYVLLFNYETLLYTVITKSEFDKVVSKLREQESYDCLNTINEYSESLGAVINDQNKVIINKDENIIEVNPTFILSYNCNYRCDYCYQNKYKTCKEKLKEEDLENINLFYELYSHHYSKVSKISSISIMGGEPFLEENKNILNKIFEIWPNSEYIFTTNGSYILSYTDLLTKMSKVRMRISLDGIRDVHYKKRIPTDRSLYGMTMEGISWLTKHDIPINILTVFRPEYKDSYSAFLDQLENYGWPNEKFGLGFLLETNGGSDSVDKNYYLKCIETIEELVTGDSRFKYSNIQKLLPKEYLSSMLIKESQKHGVRLHRCDALFTPSYTFAPDGKIYLCPASNHEDTIVGTFRPKEFVDFERIEMFQARTVDRLSSCNNCIIKSLCKGGCPISALITSSNIQTGYCGNWNITEPMKIIHEALELVIREDKELFNK